jgi:4-amino-4-deoxy-L-arabinose transferase-like glycosyltransferase
MGTPPTPVSEERSQGRGLRPLNAAFALLAAGLLLHSQTMAFHWDEGFHILAAYLIALGKRPYLDFFFPQPPLNAYWNAAWMGIFGPSWRAVHAVAALATLASVVLIAQYLFSIFPDRRWRSAAAFAALALFGLHTLVWEFGAISQAYPLCLLLVVAAFRLAIVAVSHARPGMSALTGVLAGTAAACSLLTAPACVVLLVWMWLHNRAGSRWSKAAAFVAGAAAPSLPLLLLFARGPHVVIFDVLKYNSLYRRVEWPGATAHDIGIVTDWVNGSQSLLLALLAAAGLLYLMTMGFDHPRRSEIRLCIWLALGLGAQNLFAHPTFPQYFVFMIPFLTVLAGIGFYAVAVRLGNPERPRAPVVLALGIAVLCVANTLWDDRESYSWRKLEQVADKVRQVTPKGAPLVAPEQIYVLARWPVPPGLEDDDVHKLNFSPAENARLHITPKAELDQRIKAGGFPTAVSCDDDRTSELQGWDVYSQTAELGECTVFWQFKKSAAQPPR